MCVTNGKAYRILCWKLINYYDDLFHSESSCENLPQFDCYIPSVHLTSQSERNVRVIYCLYLQRW